jgi:geranylgeranyl pyrophosphate synthase/predicted secreted hydrolase
MNNKNTEFITTESSLPVEFPKTNHDIEWWFYQGFFEGENMPRYYFMVSFFRHNFSENHPIDKNCYSLLFSLLNSDTGEHLAINQIDKTYFDEYSSMVQNVSNTVMDPDLFEMFKNELNEHGCFEPAKIKKVSVDLINEKLDIRWENFSLEQNESYFRLTFPFGEDGDMCTVDLTPVTQRYTYEAESENDEDKGYTTYHCYPNLKLRGNAGDHPVAGQAWMDHQWGKKDKKFIFPSSKNEIVGWDWFGISLNNGMYAIFSILKFIKTGEIIRKRVALLKENGEFKFYKDFIAKPLQYWQSPETLTDFPLYWELGIPEAELKLTFSPVHNNQEIPYFGLERTLWEGAGYVEGTYKGSDISGLARGEFHGYGYILDFNEHLDKLVSRVEKNIEEFFPKTFTEDTIQTFVGKPVWKNDPAALTEMISKPVWELMLRKGKRWRPIFGIWIQEALGKPAVNYEKGVCLSELIHSGSLIIDDIQDNSQLRRGKPTLHLQYGTDVAINAGNTLYFLPSVELYHHKHLNVRQKLRIHEIMMNTFVQSHFGQTMDIYWSKELSEDNLKKWLNEDIESKILQMYDYKTASGPCGLTMIAAMLSETNKMREETAIEFSRAFSVAFQLLDDIRNFSSSPKWTKTSGEDITSGKLTYVIVKAIRALGHHDSQRLIEIICNTELRTDPDMHAEAVSFILKSGALDSVKNEAEEMMNKGWERFAKTIPPSEAKIMLNMLCKKLLDLPYEG